mmetsp:Transcript_13685/g.43238  ORF Transcript_13685/g.43238 Transcript_13685/m.43238 type:complete len:526 (-) Transcript_13685:83-1660(-)|eukprot:CAMPEP_0182853476 /NCGR_PEP_ID=MMETSP0034_2-20130328/712_1 /TAXON_ID=156128 /ORGANISM="Nephroselmis pyriformis, Strain CCMP717" /LENGTH=525 /DNA_ID=CAMNT_0024984247 /DNA_START=338 /DNA_END=1915 /DNA_ORIENTATION=+
MGICGSKEGDASSNAASPQANSSAAAKAAAPAAASAGSKQANNKKMSNTVLGRESEDLHQFYTLGKVLGRGQFGVTKICTDKKTGEQLACKTISKRKLRTKEDIEDVRREVAIMHHLAGHPHVVNIRNSYEDKDAVHLVMEMCTGGELFDRIIKVGHYTEKKAAALTRTMLEIVGHCHQMGVIHRDLKPENFLMDTPKDDAIIKTTDFGLSVFYKPGDRFKDLVGSAYYIAPEVLRRNYSQEADVWSVGVILYILLCGVPPFWAEGEQGIFDAVLSGPIDFESDPWPSISSGAKEAIKDMLIRDPSKRKSAADMLNHPWIKEDGASDKPLDNTVLNRLQQFAMMNKLKKMALRVIAHNLSDEEIAGLKALFQSIDEDNSGSITYDELRDGLKRMGSVLAENEIKQLMSAADVDGNGSIDYEEFIAATVQRTKVDDDDNLKAAFQHFDKDDSGKITLDEMNEALKEWGGMNADEASAVLAEVDKDGDGKIDYQEFQLMMRNSAVASALNVSLSGLNQDAMKKGGVR